MLIDEMRARLQQAFAPVQLEITDMGAAHVGHHHRHTTEATGHFDVRIVSAAFAGLPRVARHRAIYVALGELMQTDVHALAIDARAPGES